MKLKAYSLVLVLSLLGCEGARVGLDRSLPSPEVTVVSPAVGFSGERVAVEIRGADFLPRVFQDPSALDGIAVDEQFAAFVGEVALEEVRFVDVETLNATVPAGLDPGAYDVRVLTPNDLEGVLAEGYRASADAAPRLDAVDPDIIVAGVDTEVTLLGVGLSTGATVALSNGDEVSVLGAGEAGVRARIDAGTPAGDYGLQLTNPDGQIANLDDALTIRPPAALDLEVTGAPEINIGQEALLTVTVTNSGGSDVEQVDVIARNLDETLLTVVTLPSTIPRVSPGESVVVTLGARGLGAGASGLGLTAAGVNEISERLVSSVEVVHDLIVDAPALLVGELSAEAITTLGEQQEITFTVRNNGDASALGVAPSLPVVTPAGALTLAVSPAPASADIPGGGSAAFTFTVEGAAPGEATVAIAATGTDENDGVAVSSLDVAAPITVADPFQLAGLLTASPPQVSLGQLTVVTLEVTNNDTGDAIDVRPALVTTSGSGNLVGPVPAALDLAPGAQGTFTFELTPNAAGLINLSATATATSPLGVGLRAPEILAAVPAQVAPSLGAAWTVPTTVSVGQAFQASVLVQNDGEASADAVTIEAPAFSGATGTACVGPSPASSTIAGGASATFTFDCTAGAEGAESLSAAAAGVDANHGDAVRSPNATSDPFTIEAPPVLTIAWSAPPEVTTGQEFNLTATVTNGGQVGASGVAVGSVVVGGATGTTCGAAVPASAAVGAGATQDFVFTCTAGAGAGNETVSAVASGVDVNSGEDVSSARTATPAVAVQTPPALSLSWSTPGQVSFGQVFAAALRITNTGGADATSVAPGGFVVNSASGTLCSGPDIASADIDSGANAVFTWTCTAGNVLGTDSVSADAGGLDANTGLPVSATPVASAGIELVGAPGLVVSWTVPGNVAPGSSFTATLTAQNTGASALNNVAADAAVFDGATGSTCGTAVPASVSLAPGQSVDFTYDCTAGVEGAETLTAGAAGVDALSGDPVTAPPLSSPVVTVVEPGEISVVVNGPAQVSTGQVFPVSVVVTNTGAVDVDATTTVSFTVNGGSGTSCAGPSPASVDLVPAQVANLDFSCTAGAAGTVSFTSSAQGIDGNTGLLVTAAPATSADATIQRAVALTATWTSTPGVLSTGQSFTAVLSVQNTGEALAETAAPAGVNISGATGTSCGAPNPATADIAGGQVADFTYSCTAGGVSGTLSLSDRASATDANSQDLVQSATATSATLTVEDAAALSATWSVPTQAIVGSNFSATLSVSNGGQAAAETVAPTGFTVNGTGVSCGAPAPASQDVPGGASRDFVYTCSATQPGFVSFTAGASGADENSTLSVAAGAVTSASVEAIEFSAVVINEIVTDPQFDWGDSLGGDGIAFNRVPGRGVADAGDEWIELFNTEIDPVDLTGWTLLIDDGTPATITLGVTPVVLRFSGGGSLTNLQGGEFLTIGLAGVTSMADDVTLTLRDDFDNTQDLVSLGNSTGGDGNAANNAPSGAATASTDAVARVPNGADTDDDSADFAQALSTIGTDNECSEVTAPSFVSGTEQIFDNIKLGIPGTFSHAVAAGSDRYLVVAIMSRKTEEIASVTYAGVEMTNLGFADDGGEVRNTIFGLFNPPAGTANVAIDVVSNDTDAIANAINIVGVRQHASVDDTSFEFGVAETNSMDVTVVRAGSFVVDHFAWKDNVANPASGQTSRWNTDDFKSSGGATVANAGAGPLTLTWNIGANKDFAHGAVVLAPQCQ